MQQEEFVVCQPGCGNVTDGSVDFYEMDWEIVDPGPIEEDDCGCSGSGGGDDGTPIERRCIDNQPQQTDDAGGYEIINV